MAAWDPRSRAHWDTNRIEFNQLAGFGVTGGIGYTVENGTIIVGAWVRSDPPNKAKASLAAWEIRNDPVPTFKMVAEGMLPPSSDIPVDLAGRVPDWQVRIELPATERQPARKKVVSYDLPESLEPYLRIKRLGDGKLILATADRAPQ